ncbi:MAG: LytTR family DNA-binding domain-containing protein [Defluviitaleaceae bacterium]|nr:LytTR family DNA-binding domain-containing protein [Defluviitaleaceae bacterium]
MQGIIICDDDKFMLDMSAEVAFKCIEKENLNARIVCATQDSAEVMLYIKKNPGDYLYFLDIDLGRTALNGVDIARLIKKQEPFSKIVFVTSHADMGMDILKSGVEAFGFIEKTADKGKMIQAYKKYIRLVLENNKGNIPMGEPTVNLLIGIDEYVSLPISQILYVETDKAISHFVRYHTVDGSDLSVRDTIESVLQKLGDDFMKSHRSVIINKNYVVSVSDGVVNFAGGEQADCSFRLKNEVMKKCGVKKV